MFTIHIHVFVQAIMSIIFMLSDVSMTPPSHVNRVAKQYADIGPSGRHGQDAQKHVVVGKGHVIESFSGMMEKQSSKKIQKAVIQVYFKNGD